MRELKFRFYNKRNNAYSENMKDGISYAVSNDGVVLLDNAEGQWIDTGLIAEQFTGLKDTHGKEIYESDCVRFPIHDGATVVWNVNKACFEFDANKHYCEPHMNQECEIVGNIHDASF
jgi:hypothetical protein